MEDIARTHEKSFFTQKVYTTGKWPVYTISHQLHASGPCRSWQRAGTNQTWTGCGSFKFQWQKALQFEAWGQSSTAGVALVNMTAPAGSLPVPLTVSTPKLIRLFRPRCLFVRNRRCGVSIKKARKEWHPSKKVPNSAYIVSRGRKLEERVCKAFKCHLPPWCQRFEGEDSQKHWKEPRHTDQLIFRKCKIPV